ncbi:MAG: hypothetical protein PHC41_15860 [Lachnospiraceae bacterium]|nr:hypothetical protein [Lachnospiraceae bacterium]MDD3617666.1 hypothetical protein [Lachnospiraceae bacterium]
MSRYGIGLFKRKNILLLVVIFLCLTTAGIYAYTSSSVSVINHLKLGDVNIGLIEYELDSNGKEIPYQDNKLVLPGDEVSKIPRITNYAEDCYIRVKIDFQNDLDMEGISAENLKGISNKWIFKNGYYYYTNPLRYGEHADIFDGIDFPPEWTEVHSMQHLQILIDAEAIQAQNFMPDFKSESPWGNEEIEICLHSLKDRDFRKDTADLNTYQDLSIVYDGTSSKLLAVSDDFFTNFSQAMPGSSLKDSVCFLNTAKKATQVFFQTGLPDNLSEDELELMEKIPLIITMENQTIYEGNLKASALNNGISLGCYNPGSNKVFDFKLQIPKDLKNNYALTETKVKWIFSVHSDAETSAHTKPVKTGDYSKINIYLMSVLLSVSALLIFIIKKWGGKKNEAKENKK